MRQFYETYVAEFKSQPTSILDIGSRDGDDAERFRAWGDIKLENVFVVEPHPLSFKELVSHYPYFRTFQLAISETEGVVDFNAIPFEYGVDKVGTSSLRHLDDNLMKRIGEIDPQHWIKVLSITGKTLMQLIDMPEIDLVKIDVEGMTYEVLKSFGEDIRKFKMLHIEVEKIPFWSGQHCYDEVKKYLESMGFKELYFIGLYLNGSQGDSVWIRQ